jgi:hypothetical protein
MKRPKASHVISRSVRGLVFLGFVLLTACESVPLTTPYPAYDEAVRPLSDTAIFQAWNGQRHIGLRVEEVDGKARGCVSHQSFGNHACLLWVRVAPGNHTFLIRVHFDLHGNTYWRTVGVPVAAPNMQATHTYLLDFDPASGRPPVVLDLGAHAKHPLKMCRGMQGCSTVIPTFD